MGNWTRSGLKQRAKICMRRYYWAAVIVCAIFMILQMASGNQQESTVDTYRSYQAEDGTEYRWSFDYSNAKEYAEQYFYSWTNMGMFSSAFSGAVLTVAILLTLLRIFLSYFIVNPIQVGMARFFYRNREIKTSVGELAFAFNREDYLPVVKTMFIREIYILLWTLLLVVPGIIKSYEYRMVDYILAENPSMPTREALNLSRQMTYGHKWNMFVLDLSFFGWLFLGAITFGLVNIFYTNPYRMAAEAELYDVLKAPFKEGASQDAVF